MSEYPAHFHDHPTAVVALPEYHQARLALDQLVKATLRSGCDLASQEDWIAMVADFASTNVYGDLCRRCRDRPDVEVVYPYRTVSEDDHWVTGTYRCPVCRLQWECGWAIDFPYHFEPTY